MKKFIEFLKNRIFSSLTGTITAVVITALVLSAVALLISNSAVDPDKAKEQKQRETSLSVIGKTVTYSSDKKNVKTLTDFRESTPTPVPTPTPYVPVITIDYEDIDEPIPYGTVYKNDINLGKGMTRVVPGENGIRTKVYEITFTDGVETSRRLVATKTKKAAKDKTVYEGSNTGVKTYKGFNYTGVLSCNASAYKDGDGGWGNHVAFSDVYYPIIEHLYTRWGVIATDPTVIPKGTKVYVEGLNGTKDYGYAVAADIGSAIKGNLIDLWMDAPDLVGEWGLRPVNVYILEDQTVNVFDLRGDYEWTYR